MSKHESLDQGSKGLSKEAYARAIGRFREARGTRDYYEMVKDIQIALRDWNDSFSVTLRKEAYPGATRADFRGFLRDLGEEELPPLARSWEELAERLEGVGRVEERAQREERAMERMRLFEEREQLEVKLRRLSMPSIHSTGIDKSAERARVLSVEFLDKEISLQDLTLEEALQSCEEEIVRLKAVQKDTGFWGRNLWYRASSRETGRKIASLERRAQGFRIEIEKIPRAFREEQKRRRDEADASRNAEREAEKEAERKDIIRRIEKIDRRLEEIP